MNSSLTQLSQSASKVQNALDEHGLNGRVVELSDTTRTSRDAANAVGCLVGQIAKSLIFQGQHSGLPILVIASGSNRVDENKLAVLIGEKPGKADADFVRENTGYVIGGVPPIGHTKAIKTFVDENLLQYEKIWAAAGTPNAVFQLTPAELLKITGARAVEVKQ